MKPPINSDQPNSKPLPVINVDIDKNLEKKNSVQLSKISTVSESLKGLLTNISGTLLDTNKFTKMFVNILTSSMAELNTGILKTREEIINSNQLAKEGQKQESENWNQQEVRDIENKRENGNNKSQKLLDMLKDLPTKGINTVKALPTMIDGLYKAILDPTKMLALVGGGAILSKLVRPQALLAFAAFSASVSDAYMATLKSEENNTGLFSSAIAGFVGGEGSKKLFGQIAGTAINAGGWAIMGATVGAIAGPPGIIAGALIGAAIGAVGAYLGESYIADKLDQLGVWFKRSLDLVFGTQFRLNPAELAKEGEKAQQFIDSKTDEIKTLQTQLLEAKNVLSGAIASGDQDMIKAYQEKTQIIQSEISNRQSDIEREKSKLKTIIEDRKLAEAGWLERTWSVIQNMSPIMLYANAITENKEFQDRKKEITEGISTRVANVVATHQRVYEKYKKEFDDNMLWLGEQYEKSVATPFFNMKNKWEKKVGEMADSVQDFAKQKKDIAFDKIGNLVDIVSVGLTDIRNTISKAFDQWVNDAKKWIDDKFKFDISWDGAKKFLGFGETPKTEVVSKPTILPTEKQIPSNSSELAKETLGKIYRDFTQSGQISVGAQVNNTNNSSHTSVVNKSSYAIMPSTSDGTIIFSGR